MGRFISRASRRRCAIDENGNVILVGQYRFHSGLYSWEIPEGGGPKDIPAVEWRSGNFRECGIVAKSWMEILAWIFPIAFVGRARCHVPGMESLPKLRATR